MTETTPDTIAARVARGAALLDEKWPGWVERIDLDTLDLVSACDCVLGQLEIDYTLGLAAIFWKDDGHGRAEREAQRHGFNAWGDGVEILDDEGAGAEYVALTAAWRDLITARRSGGAS